MTINDERIMEQAANNLNMLTISVFMAIETES